MELANMATELRDLARTVYQSLTPGLKYKPKKNEIADTLFARVDELLEALAISAISGLQPKDSVNVATTANVNLTTGLAPTTVLNGVTLTTGMSVLVKAQTNPNENGIYVVQASGAALRRSDADTPSELRAAGTLVSAGTVDAGSYWITSYTTGVLGSTPIPWLKMLSAVDLSGITSILASVADLTSLTNQFRQTTAIRSSHWYIHQFQDDDGRILAGFNPDGTLDVNLSASSLAASGSGYISPATYSQNYNAFNVRQSGGFRAATIQDDDGVVFDAKYLIGGVSDAGFVDGASSPEVIALYGQSNAGRGGYTGVLLSTALFPQHCATFSTLGEKEGPSTVSLGSLVDLRPAADPPGGLGVSGQFPATMSAFAMERFDRDAKRRSPGYLTWTAWQSGMPLSSFVSGGPNFTNLITGLTGMKNVAGTKYGRLPICRAVSFVQGESGPLNATDWRDQFLNIFNDLRPAVKTAMGQAFLPDVIIWQTNLADTATAMGLSDLGQLLAGRALFGAGGVLAGPMYSFPMAGPSSGGDKSHLAPLGRFMHGEMDAHVRSEMRKGVAFKPLWPISHARSGATITTTYNIPAGGLTFDTDWVATTPNKGFQVFVNGVEVTISSVTIVGATTQIVLAATPAGGSTVEVLYGQLSPNSYDGWSEGRGLLYSPTTVPSVYYRLGFAIPQYLRHYCCRFRETV